MTDQPKWTPGPWFIVTPTQGFEVCTIHGVEQQPTEDGLGQTWVYIRPESLVRDGEWHWPDEVECTANARLIASAPDLYAALDAAMAFIESHVADPDITDVMIRNYRTLQDLRPRDVLAKARGETK